MIKKHVLRFVNKEYAIIDTFELLTPDFCRELAYDCADDGFYSDGHYYMQLAKTNSVAFWEKTGSVGTYTNGSTNLDYLFRVNIPNGKLVKVKDKNMRYEFGI